MKFFTEEQWAKVKTMVKHAMSIVADKLIQHIDKNHDGKMNWDEFKTAGPFQHLNEITAE